VVRDVQRGLEQLFGPYATWKLPHQSKVAEKIAGLTGHETVIIMLPTGAGKSALFVLPALWKASGTNIIFGVDG
jgi:superfamily II DNA helicase RecQ